LFVNFDNFKIVEGEDITKYYNVENYVENAKGTLGTSCMRESKCENFIKFYAINKDRVKLVIMFGDGDDKIAGRALLWTLGVINGDDDIDRLFMDRIYATNDIEIDMFKAFAKKNGWLHKYRQNMSSNERIVDTTNDKTEPLQMVVDGIKGNSQYPYMDTMKYYAHNDGTLTNEDGDEADIYKLESTKGGYQDLEADENDGRVLIDGDYYDEDQVQWCTLGEEYVLEDDATWVAWESAYATEEWMSENSYYSQIMGEHIDGRDVVELVHYDDYVSTEYAEDYMTYSKIDQTYYENNDTVYSVHYGSFIQIEGSVGVITDYDDQSEVDYRYKLDNETYFVCTTTSITDGRLRNLYYDNSLKNHFIKVIIDILHKHDEKNPFKWESVYDEDGWAVLLDKDKDKDKYFEHEGHYFLKTLKTDITKK
jgi:hypothetical protein